MKEGSLLFIFKDEKCLFIRIFRILGIAIIKNDTEIGLGYQISLIIWQLEFGLNITRRRGDYVKRIKNEKGPKASA